MVILLIRREHDRVLRSEKIQTRPDDMEGLVYYYFLVPYSVYDFPQPSSPKS